MALKKKDLVVDKPLPSVIAISIDEKSLALKRPNELKYFFKLFIKL